MKIEIDYETVDKIMVKELKRNYKNLKDEIKAITVRMDKEWADSNIPDYIWEDYNSLINVLGSSEILLEYYMVSSEYKAWLNTNTYKDEL